MAVTSYKFFTTTGFDASGFGAGTLNSWTNPTNVYADDTNYATAGNPAVSLYQSYGGPSFGIPAGSVINGIEVEVVAKRGGSNIGLNLGIHQGAGTWKTKSVTLTSSSDQVCSYGGATDLWGGVWTESNFTDDNFALYLNIDAYADTVSVDYIKIRIYYTPSAKEFNPNTTPKYASQASYWKLDGNSNDVFGANNGTDNFNEVISAYTEVDPQSKLTLAAARVTWANGNTDTTYISKDYGANHFTGNFRHTFDFRLSSKTGGNGHMLWALSNYLGDAYWDRGSSNSLGVFFYGANGIMIAECAGGTFASTYPTVFQPEVDTTYYCTVRRDTSVGTYGTVYLDIYSDAAKTTSVSSTSYAMTSSVNYRYLMSVWTYGSTLNGAGYVENIRVDCGYGTIYGKISQGAGFNGSTSKITIGTAIAMPTNLSISAWVKTVGGVTQVIFSDMNAAGTVGWFFFIDANNKIGFEWDSASGNYRQYITDSGISANTWTFVTVTQSGTDAPIFYVDGSSSASSLNASAGANTKPTTGQGSSLGVMLITTPQMYFNGAMDEVGLWSKILTSTEITELYNSGSGLAYPFGITVDGFAGRQASENFATIRAGAGTQSFPSAANCYAYGNRPATWAEMDRGILLFDISGLPTGAVITGAALSLYVSSLYTGFAQNICLVSSSPASNTNIVNVDYAVAGFGSTDLATRLAVSGMTASLYNDFTLNAAGISFLQTAQSGAKIVKFGLMIDCDLDNTDVAGTGEAGIQFKQVDAGTSYMPRLIIAYTTGLSTSVSDSITVSENISLNIPVLFVSVYDSVTVSENVSLSIPVLPISVYDSVTVSENVSLSIPVLFVSVFESVTISENVFLNIPVLFFSTSDSITVSEDVYLEISGFYIYESVTVSENVSLNIPVLFVSVSDSITVSENISINIPVLFVSVYDSVTVSENVSLNIPVLFVSVSDSVTVSENVSLNIPVLFVSISESITVSEDVSLEIPTLPSFVYDSVTVSENISIEIPILFVSIYDSVTVSEGVFLETEEDTSDFEVISVSEYISIVITNLVFSVYDSIVVLENVESETSFNISVFESINVSDVVIKTETTKNGRLFPNIPRGTINLYIPYGTSSTQQGMGSLGSL